MYTHLFSGIPATNRPAIDSSRVVADLGKFGDTNSSVMAPMRSARTTTSMSNVTARNTSYLRSVRYQPFL